MKKGCFRAQILAVILLLAALAVIGPKVFNAGRKLIYPQKYEAIVESCAADYQLDSELIYAVIWTESKFKEDALSSAGAKGLMQLTQETYDWTKQDLQLWISDNGDIWLPENNIRAGSALLRFLLNHYGSPEVAFCAYNAGMGNVNGWLESREYSDDGFTLNTIPYPETRKYVDKVNHTYEIYRSIYQ